MGRRDEGKERRDEGREKKKKAIEGTDVVTWHCQKPYISKDEG